MTSPSDLCLKCGHPRSHHNERADNCSWANKTRTIFCRCYRPIYEAEE